MTAPLLWREVAWASLPDRPAWLADVQAAAGAVDAVAGRLWVLGQITGDERLRREYRRMERAHLQLDRLIRQIAAATLQDAQRAA